MACVSSRNVVARGGRAPPVAMTRGPTAGVFSGLRSPAPHRGGVEMGGGGGGMGGPFGGGPFGTCVCVGGCM